MRKTLAFIPALALAGGLAAYGVSPSQYQAGRAADSGQAFQPAPGSLPQLPPAPGVPALPAAAPQARPQNFDAMAVPDWAKEWKHYRWEEAKALWERKDALFLDARAKAEYDQGHIPGAIPMPTGEFDKYYAQYESRIREASHLITYCHGVGCQLSNKVAQRLWNEKKFRNVGSFFGGWPQWQQHSMPVETGPSPKRR